jgi:lipopolysaccharide/colanic/teichoic acid biosynthesis glycosyltransferase
MGVMLFFISESPYQTLVITILALALAFAGTHLYKNILFLNRRMLALILDAVSVGVSILLYVLIRQSAFITEPLPIPSTADLLIPSAWITIFWILVYAAGGMYDIPPELKFRYQVLNLTRLVVLSGVVFVLATYRFGGGFQISPLSVALFALILIAVNSIIRGIIHKIMADRIKSGMRKIDALIVMPAPSGLDRRDSAYSSVHFYNIVGCVGDCVPNAAKYLGPISALAGILRDNRIARVILDIPPSARDNLRPIFDAAFFMDTRFLAPAESAGALRGLKRFAAISDDVILVTINTRKIFSRMLKRLLDISWAAALLILLSPYYAVRAGLIRLGKIKPPSTYSIIGIGEHRKTIRCETDKMGNPQFRSMWGLLAVIKGDLSLVGTTLTTTEEFDRARTQIAGLWRKFLAKPGLFGPGYGGKNASERFDLDLEYTEKSSLFYDLYAIIRQLSGL